LSSRSSPSAPADSLARLQFARAHRIGRLLRLCTASKGAPRQDELVAELPPFRVVEALPRPLRPFPLPPSPATARVSPVWEPLKPRTPIIHLTARAPTQTGNGASHSQQVHFDPGHPLLLVLLLLRRRHRRSAVAPPRPDAQACAHTRAGACACASTRNASGGAVGRPRRCT
jgi:hypothetical protein